METDAEATRAEYLARLHSLQNTWERALIARGGRLVKARTDEDPVRAVRAAVEAAR